jgi:hypothetical protein
LIHLKEHNKSVTINPKAEEIDVMPREIQNYYSKKTQWGKRKYKNSIKLGK